MGIKSHHAHMIPYTMYYTQHNLHVVQWTTQNILHYVAHTCLVVLVTYM